MANLTSLTTDFRQPPVTTANNVTTINQLWCAKFDGGISPAAVDVLMRTDNTLNSLYGFPKIAAAVVGNDATPHPDNSACLPTSITSNARGDVTDSIFDIVVTYTNDRNTINESTDPLEAPPQISGTLVDRIKLVELDTVTGKVIANLVGTPITIEENRPILRLVITRNEEDWDLKEAAQHGGAMNEAPVTLLGKTFAAKLCILENWSGSDEYDTEGNLFWRVTYQILISDEEFTRDFIEHGLVDRNGNPPPQAAGISSNEPWKLLDTGEFMTKEDNRDPSVFFLTSQNPNNGPDPSPFNTLKVSDWGTAVRLQEYPATNLGGGSLTNILRGG